MECLTKADALVPREDTWIWEGGRRAGRENRGGPGQVWQQLGEVAEALQAGFCFGTCPHLHG